jgi:hypothetical protein
MMAAPQELINEVKNIPYLAGVSLINDNSVTSVKVARYQMGGKLKVFRIC